MSAAGVPAANTAFHQADELLRAMLATAGRTGLLPEQYDPDREMGLGNHPQAYSHLGVIHSALNLAAAEVEPAGGPPAK